jgi:hypothetical protein
MRHVTFQDSHFLYIKRDFFQSYGIRQYINLISLLNIYLLVNLIACGLVA